MPHFEKAQAPAEQAPAETWLASSSSAAKSAPPATDAADDAVRHLQDTMLNAATALEEFRNALAIVKAQAGDAAQRLGREA